MMNMNTRTIRLGVALLIGFALLYYFTLPGLHIASDGANMQHTPYTVGEFLRGHDVDIEGIGYIEEPPGSLRGILVDCRPKGTNQPMDLKFVWFKRDHSLDGIKRDIRQLRHLEIIAIRDER